MIFNLKLASFPEVLFTKNRLSQIGKELNAVIDEYAKPIISVYGDIGKVLFNDENRFSQPLLTLLPKKNDSYLEGVGVNESVKYVFNSTENLEDFRSKIGLFTRAQFAFQLENFSLENFKEMTFFYAIGLIKPHSSSDKNTLNQLMERSRLFNKPIDESYKFEHITMFSIAAGKHPSMTPKACVVPFAALNPFYYYLYQILEKFGIK